MNLLLSQYNENIINIEIHYFYFSFFYYYFFLSWELLSHEALIKNWFDFSFILIRRDKHCWSRFVFPCMSSIFSSFSVVASIVFVNLILCSILHIHKKKHLTPRFLIACVQCKWCTTIFVLLFPHSSFFSFLFLIFSIRKNQDQFSPLGLNFILLFLVFFYIKIKKRELILPPKHRLIRTNLSPKQSVI